MGGNWQNCELWGLLSIVVAPSCPAWVHEIKHDGYRRTPQGMRIKTRRDIEAAERLRATSFVLDREGVILRPDGMSDFDALHERRRDREVQLLAFDLLELDGKDQREQPWNGARLRAQEAVAALAWRLQFNEHVEEVDGATVFEHACRFGLEGIVSKRHGRSRAWLKIRNPASPAMTRVWEERF